MSDSPCHEVSPASPLPSHSHHHCHPTSPTTKPVPPPMSQLSRCRPRLLKLLTPSFPLLSSKRHHNPIGWIPLYTARRRLQSSSTRIQIRTVPSRETQRAIDRVELVLHKLEASSCVSSSKIQLALRGLQQQEAPVRIGGAPLSCLLLFFFFIFPNTLCFRDESVGNLLFCVFFFEGTGHLAHLLQSWARTAKSF